MNSAMGDEANEVRVASKRSLADDPLDATLLGKYLRLVMIGTAGSTVIYWSWQIGVRPLAPVMITISVLVLAALTSPRFAGLIRLLMLLAIMIGLIIIVGSEGDWTGPIVFFSPVAMLCNLGILAGRDAIVALRHRFEGISSRAILTGMAIAIAVTYLVIVPVTASLLDQFKEPETGVVSTELTPLQELRVRTTKFIVFSMFAYFGACIGSFFNVIADSAPRGQRIAFRSSACPVCDSPIRRLDNLPIISYLALNGKCRTCKAPIPVRYFVVELIAMSIFASLFLYELVTGAANVPGFQHYHHVGILWIILYTKWPVVGIYFYHGMMFSFLLVFALIETDGLRCPKWMSALVVGAFALLAVAIAVLQPVSLDDQLPVRFAETIPAWSKRALTCLAGGLAGWLIALVSGRAQSISPPTASWILLGVALGWQATVTIALLWSITSFAIHRIRRGSAPKWLGPAAVLFAVSMLHHPAWKWLSRFW